LSSTPTGTNSLPACRRRRESPHDFLIQGNPSHALIRRGQRESCQSSLIGPSGTVPSRPLHASDSGIQAIAAFCSSKVTWAAGRVCRIRKPPPFPGSRPGGTLGQAALPTLFPHAKRRWVALLSSIARSCWPPSRSCSGGFAGRPVPRHAVLIRHRRRKEGRPTAPDAGALSASPSRLAGSSPCSQGKSGFSSN
jgi:hypothetical protein